MKEINLDYLEKNFLTLEQVASRTGISEAEIKVQIDARVMPKPSYVVRQSVEITSPLGDKHQSENTTFYFPQSYVDLLKDALQKEAEDLKESLISEMRRHLIAHPKRSFAYGNVFDSEGNPIENKISTELEKEWEYYNQGIYGICTLHATAREIIEKEIAVKRLLAALERFPTDELINHKDELAQIIDEFDKVSNLFAPYQRESSSRGKYVDKTLKHIGMEEKVKKY